MYNFLITNGTVITVDSGRRIISDGAVAVEDGRIVAVGKTSKLKEDYSSLPVIDAINKLVLPGLVNTHSHLFAMFSRGIGVDGARGVSRKKRDYSWDVDRLSLFDGDVCRASADLAVLEMLWSGITTTQDSHYINFHREAFDGVAQAVVDSGIRAVLGRGCWDAPGLAPAEKTETVKEAIRESRRVIDRWHGEGDGRVNVRVEASMLAQCTDEMMVATKELAKQRDIGWATHLQYRLATSRTDPRREFEGLDRYEGRSVEYLEDLGVLGPESLLIHCTHIDDVEIDILSKTNTPVAHCPNANAWGGNPVVTPVPSMLEKGVTVGLGTDSVATNDSLDLFQTMKFCALIHKVKHGSSAAMTAEKVLEMSTIDAARALGLDSQVGSLEPGKKADIILLDTFTPGLVPSFKPVKNIVYGLACGRAVDTVIVDGKIIVDSGGLKTMNEEKVYSRSEKVGREILRKNGTLGETSRYLTASPWRNED